MIRIGIINDLHLGHTGEGRWHNRLLYDHAEEIARAAVAALNRLSLDRVLVLGDITEAGTEEQLLLARDILGKIEAPWLVLPGNHDRVGVHSGQFARVFAGHVPDLYIRWDEIGLLTLREKLPDDGSRPDGYRLGGAVIEEAVARVAEDRPALLLVASHIPLISEVDHPSAHAGKYAVHHADGQELLARLAPLMKQRGFVFCAHQHWHHVSECPRWVQLTNAAMIEYPMELRLATIDGGGLGVSTVPAACREMAARSLDNAPWVVGRECDRECVLVAQP
jgi:hypothetical protein